MCDVSHGCCWRGAVPMLLTLLEPDHVTRPDFLDRSAPALHSAAAGRDNQSLTEGMGVPCRPGTGFERDAGSEQCAPDQEPGTGGRRAPRR
jgi:hypothetical protein